MTYNDGVIDALNIQNLVKRYWSCYKKRNKSWCLHLSSMEHHTLSFICNIRIQLTR